MSDSKYLTEENLNALLDSKLEAAIEKITANTAKQINDGLDNLLNGLIAEASEIEDEEAPGLGLLLRSR